MSTKKKTNNKFKKIKLHGYTIKFDSKQIIITNKDNVDVEAFQVVANKLATYMHDEMFIADGDYDIFVENK